MNIFSSLGIVNSYYMTSTRGNCFEKVSLFRALFHINGEFFLFISLEICFQEICLVFYVSNIMLHQNFFPYFILIKSIYFLEWSKYFARRCIVRGSLVTLYPCL